MLNKNNLIIAGLAGVSAAAVTLIGIGGYFLHRKVLKHYIQSLAWRQAMNLVFSDMDNGKANTHDDFDGYKDYYEEYGGEYDYGDDFFENFDTEENRQ